MDKINFINGVETMGMGETLIVRNPANSEVLLEYRASSRTDVECAVSTARESLKVWKNCTIEERARILSNAANLIIEDQGNPGDLLESEIMHLIIDEMGKSIYEAETEVFESADILNYFASEAVELLRDERPILDNDLWPTKESIICYNPVGVVGIIKAWNYPLEIPIWSIGAALLCGNTVVFKPSEFTPLIGKWLGNIFKKAGLPNGVFNVVCGNHDTGELLVNSDINMISFTGSTEVGMLIAEKCAKRNIKYSLEMGGKDPAIICEDADIERTVNGVVWGALANAGQVCVSTERIYIHEKKYDEFITKATELIEKLNIGDGWNHNTDVTAMISEQQLEHVHSQVLEAILSGAKVICGGKRMQSNGYEKGFYYEPTLIVDVCECMSVFSKETFGPVLAVQRFNDYDEVIKKANSSEYGLGASIWTTSESRAMDLANKVEAGMVWINDVNLCFPQCPWIGVKKSGMGCDLSKHGIFEYCNFKHISIEKDKQPSQPWWYPYKK